MMIASNYRACSREGEGEVQGKEEEVIGNQRKGSQRGTPTPDAAVPTTHFRPRIWIKLRTKQNFIRRCFDVYDSKDAYYDSVR